jgi:hypothetical protein
LGGFNGGPCRFIFFKSFGSNPKPFLTALEPSYKKVFPALFKEFPTLPPLLKADVNDPITGARILPNPNGVYFLTNSSITGVLSPNVANNPSFI